MSEGTVAQVLAGEATWALVEGDCREVLPTLPDKGVAHVITDPPYSEHTHAKQRSGASQRDADEHDACIARARDLGFPAITADEMAQASATMARLAKRWVMRFTDFEGVGDWIRCDAAAGLQHVRVGVWIKLNATPQFTGDRPATGAEAIVIAHRPGRKRWNGGGNHAVWTHAIEMNRGGSNARLHTTQKPLPLMLRLVELFTDPGDLVLDPFCGSGTTGVACIRLGRRFIGIEREPKYAAVARERLRAEERGLSLREARLGQTSIFDALGAAK